MELFLALAAIAGSIAVTAIFYAGLHGLIQWAASLGERHKSHESKAGKEYVTAVLPPEYDINDANHVALLDRIRTAFAASLQDETGPYSQCIYKPASTLPYPKDAIRSALTALREFAEYRRESTLLDTSLRSPHAAQAIRGCLVYLDHYLEVSPSDLPTTRLENFNVGSEHEKREARKRTSLEAGRELEALRSALRLEREAEARFVGGPGMSVPTEIGEAIQATDAAFRVLDDRLRDSGQDVTEACEAIRGRIANERRQRAHKHTAPRVTFLRGALGNAIYFAIEATDSSFVTLAERLGNYALPLRQECDMGQSSTSVT